MKNKLRIAKYLISYEANGPGKRFVIWFQGCPFRCKGCINPEFLNVDKGKFIDIHTLIDLIKFYKETEKIEGVTFTGGEPLFQAKNLLKLVKAIKTENLSIFCFTGYNLQDILDDKIPYAKDVLKYIDILVDGPYIEEKKTNLRWIGSENQKIYFLSKKYENLKKNIEKERVIELNISENELHITGVFDTNFWEILKNKLK